MHKTLRQAAVARFPQGLRGRRPPAVVHAGGGGALPDAVGAVAAGAGARGGAGRAAVRAPPSRADADADRRRVPSRRHRHPARAGIRCRRRAHAHARPRPHAVDHGVVRVAVGDSAAVGVPRAPPRGRGLRRGRRSPGGPRRAATSTSPFAISPKPACPQGAVRLFGERMLPVASPALAHRQGLRLARPADLAQHVLLHLDDPEGRMPWLDWRAWLAANGEPALKPAGSLRFKLYDQVIQAAVGGQGVALGRIPLIAEHLRDGRLVAPFPEALRFGARLLCDRRAARGRPRRRRQLRRVARRRGGGRGRRRRRRRSRRAAPGARRAHDARS